MPDTTAAPRSGLRDRQDAGLGAGASARKLYFGLKRSQVLYLPHDEGYLIIEEQPRGVHLQGMLGPPQRRVTPAGISVVPLFDAAGLLLDFGLGRLASVILE